MINNRSILQEAEELVNGDRASDYGPAIESFARIANIANVLFTDTEKDISGINEVMLCKIFVALKLSRQTNKHKRDNLVDLAGYAYLWNEIEEALK